jgi:hypothetical protein
MAVSSACSLLAFRRPGGQTPDTTGFKRESLMGTHRSSVYLSGWEYNRLLQEDPAQPRISALPAAILWNGSHQLWMFETIYCSKESFELEVEATERLGWVNGLVLRELYDQGVFRTIDWASLPAETKDKLYSARTSALAVLSAQGIKDAIVAGDAATLELAKALVLQPILDYYKCFESGAPNSVNNWFKPFSGAEGHRDQARPTVNQKLADEKIDHLANLVTLGLDLCRPPGTGVSQQARDLQRHVQDTIEKPMIPQLLAGDGRFAGPHGFVPYLRTLETVKGAYTEINQQLLTDWQTNRANLLRLREAASRYLWHDLHGYWLPRLLDQQEDGRKVGHEFDRWIKSALRVPGIIKYLHNRPTTVIVGAFGPSALTAALAHAGVPVPEAIVSGGLAGLAGMAGKNHLDQVARLAMFFQESRRSVIRR